MTPHFFYVSDITKSSSFNGKIFRKKSMLENFRANVLKKTTSVPVVPPVSYIFNIWEETRDESDIDVSCVVSLPYDLRIF